MSEPTAMSRSSEYSAENSAPPAPVGEFAAEGMATTHKRQRMTDSARMPALRLNRPVRRTPTEKRPAVNYDTTAPGYLRVARLFMGLVLLASAWGCILLVVSMVLSLSSSLPQQHVSLSMHVLLWALGVCGMLWLAVISLALIIVGAFSLTLALTRRKW